MIRLRGIAASEGIAFGRAYLIDHRAIKAPQHHISADQVDAEIARFRGALDSTRQQLQRLMDKLPGTGQRDHKLILEAHQLMLQDEQLIDETVRNIAQQQINAEWALSNTVEQIKRLFDQLEDDYFRERGSDVGFVADHLLHTLTGDRRAQDKPPADAVVVAPDLSPAETAQIYRCHVKAFVTAQGGRTSHTSIVARSLSIPAVVGAKQATQVVGNGDILIVDGYRGEVLVCPDEDTIGRYQRRVQRRQHQARALRRERELPAETEDGVSVRLMANIELPDEIPAALTQGVEGIGLYRTEFIYLGRRQLPTEQEHLQDAQQVLRLCGGTQVTFRTCDLGADKMPGSLNQAPQTNPALGMMSIRLCLEHPAIFRTQLRGLLRAAVGGDMRIMFPMVSGIEELRQARAVLDGCVEDLREEGVKVPRVPVGIMVEMPSAAVTADLLAREADFFSIGTNDLTQYSLAIDRVNQHVNYMFRPYHPAILRLIRYVVKAAQRTNIPVSVCGEMAGDPLMSLVLVGLGVRELSMSAQAVPRMKRLIRGCTMATAKQIAERALRLPTPQQVEQELMMSMHELFPAERFGAPGDWDEDTVA